METASNSKKAREENASQPSANTFPSLGAKKEMFRLILDAAPIALIVSDKKGVILFANPQMEKTFGYSRKELTGQPIHTFLPLESKLSHEKNVDAFFHHPSIRPMGANRDLFGKRKDGRLIPLEIGLAPIQLSDESFVLASIVDISERKQVQKERYRLEQEILEATDLEKKRIGQELHDSLGQHLQGISFLCNVLKKKLSEKKGPEGTEASRISELVEKAISMTRQISRDLYASELEAHGLYEALKHLVANVNATTNIECRFSCETPFEVDDKLVANNLYRIAQEALHNACRHSMATQIILAATITNNRLRLIIKDNGVGLSDKLENSTGMGCKTMRYRADIIGGSLNIMNDTDGGAIVTCSAPLIRSTTPISA